MSRIAMARRIEESHIKDQVRKQMEAYRQATSDRERRNIINGVVIIPRSDVRFGRYEEDTYYEEPIVQSLDEQYPPHGKRGTYSAVYSDPQFGEIAASQAPLNPDGTRPKAAEFSEGWREVMKRVRRKHIMTNAELERAAAMSHENDSDEGDHNGDLTDRNQRRNFY
jgi:hypothetical protein